MPKIAKPNEEPRHFTARPAESGTRDAEIRREDTQTGFTPVEWSFGIQRDKHDQQDV